MLGDCEWNSLIAYSLLFRYPPHTVYFQRTLRQVLEFRSNIDFSPFSVGSLLHYSLCDCTRVLHSARRCLIIFDRHEMPYVKLLKVLVCRTTTIIGSAFYISFLFLFSYGDK